MESKSSLVVEEFFIEWKLLYEDVRQSMVHSWYDTRFVGTKTFFYR